MDVKLYLALAGSLGLAYVTYNMLNKPRTITIPKEQTLRISQQIKHQIMILCISYAKSMNKIREEHAQKLKGKTQELSASARNELSQLYVAKEQLILKKFSITREIYGKSLEKWKHQKKLVKNTEEILNMLECAVEGKIPDLTIPQNVYQKFTREQILEIYKQMVTIIGKKVAKRLRQQVDSNKDFDLKSDEHFRNAVRSLQIYDLKVSFLKEKGFLESWGCPNEIFFKYLESEKLKDQAFEKKAVAYEKCYEKVIEVVSLDPKKATDQSIDEMFSKAFVVPAPVIPAPVVPVAQPVRKAPVEAPKPYVAPPKVQKKPEPIDDDAELEALMMQELMSRSQQNSKPVEEEVEEQRKIGLTTSEIQRDWERHGSIHEKQPSKMQEATEQVAINVPHEKELDKALEIKAEEVQKEVEEEVQEEPVIVEAPILDVEPVVEAVAEPVAEVVEPVAEVIAEVAEVIAEVAEVIAEVAQVIAEPVVAEPVVEIVAEEIVIVKEGEGEIFESVILEVHQEEVKAEEPVAAEVVSEEQAKGQVSEEKVEQHHSQ